MNFLSSKFWLYYVIDVWFLLNDVLLPSKSSYEKAFCKHLSCSINIYPIRDILWRKITRFRASPLLFNWKNTWKQGYVQIHIPSLKKIFKYKMNLLKKTSLEILISNPICFSPYLPSHSPLLCPVLFFLNWGITALQWCASSAIQKSESAICIHMSLPS